MDRRHQVFVSSTFLDLQEERAAVVSALLQIEAFPAGMELFPAADDDAWTLIEQVIDESDYYLLVIGGKYGHIDPETKLSFTEREYDYAVGQKKPVLAFLHGEPEKIELGKSESSEETRAKLEAFREKVKTHKHVKYWVGPDDLGGKVALSFASFRKRYPAMGWIRGDAQTSAESLGELNELRKQLADKERQLESARTQRPAGTEDLAQGDDPVDLEPIATVTIGLDGSRWRDQRVTVELEISMTWDEILSCVGPDLLDEAEERLVSRTLNGWLTNRYASAVSDAAERGLKEAKRKSDEVQRVVVELTSADFGTVLIQLKALGLIAKSEKKRSVSDTATYWTLTPYGSEHLTTLRALRRRSEGDSEKPASSEDAKAALKFSTIDVGPAPEPSKDDIPF